MPITIVCPNCKLSLKCPDQAAGKQGRCTRCKTVFTIRAAPGQNGEAQDPAPQPSPAPSAKAETLRPRRPDRAPRPERAARAAGPLPASSQPDREGKPLPAADSVKFFWKSWPVLAGGGVLLAAVLAAIVCRQVSVGRDDDAFAASLAGVEAAGNKTPTAIAALDDYLAERPGGRHAVEARDRIKALDAAEFAAAEAKAKAAREDYGKAIEAYKGYLAALPNGRSADEARKRAEKDLPAAWDDHAFAESEAQAKAAGDSALAVCAAYQRYLTAFPNGRHAQQAKAAQAKADDEDYARAKEEAEAAVPARALERAIAAYQGYLQRFPQGLNAAAAKRAAEVDLPGKMDSREFEKARTAAEAACARKDYEQAIAAYQEYLKAYPRGQHVTAAKQAVEKHLRSALDAKGFADAKASADAACAREDYERAITAYKDYLKAYPQGQQVALARQAAETDLPARIKDREARKAKAEAERKAAEDRKAEEIRKALPKMFYTVGDMLSEAVITIHNDPDGPCVVRFRLQEGRHEYYTSVNGHAVCVTYATATIQVFVPGGATTGPFLMGVVDSVTWERHPIREEKKK